MEGSSTNRRLLIATGFVLFFVVIVLVWYFYYEKPASDPNSGRPTNPFPNTISSPRFRFIGKEWGSDNSTSSTVVSDPSKEPLIKIWDRPATGQTFVTDQVLKEITASSTEGTSTILVKKTVRATSTVILFVDKTTGYVYGYPVETGQVFQISNSIIPGVHDAYFFNNGKRLILRYLDQEKNTVVSIIATVPSNANKETAFPLENIEYLTGEVGSVAVSGNTKEASYGVVTDNGTTIYTITGDGSPQRKATSPFREWLLSYGGDSLYATTKPSAYVEGTTFSIPGFQNEVTEKTGLLTLPSKSGVLLNSMWGKQGLATFLSNNGQNNVLTIKTLASKCNFGNKDLLVCAVPRTLPKATEGLPDDWYQGRVLFRDDLMLIDKDTGASYSLYSFDDTRDGSFDITSITPSDTNDLFTFTRKQDGTLWLLNINLIQNQE